MVQRKPTSRTAGWILPVSLLVLSAGTFLIVKIWPLRGVAAAQAAKRPVRSASGALQTHRNLGKAYYEQGKYVEAAEEFHKVMASGRALATDHLDLGLALMQANKLDEALGELTTAQQMDSKLTAADYNLGILYKRELRYPDAEAALKRVVEADPNDPAGWFNLGAVYFSQRKFPEALEAHERVNKMGFARGQNFYVASLFRTFTVLLRLSRKEEAQKILKIHERVRDKVPSISLQNLALEGGKYGAILVPSTPPVTVSRAPAKVTFAEVTARLGLSLAAASEPAAGLAERELEVGSKKSVRQPTDYSPLPTSYSRSSAPTLFGPSAAFGDYDGDGHTDVYVTNPAGRNQLFHNNGDGTFTDATEKAGVAGPGGSVGAAFADYKNTGQPGLIVVGAGGVTLYANKGDGTFTVETEKAGLGGRPGELDTRAVLFDADSDGYLDLVVTAYADLSATPGKDALVFPRDFSSARSHFYRNNGDGTFTEATESAGLASAEGKMRGAVFGKFTDSGFDDLVFFRDDAPPLLFVNQGEGKFADRTRAAGAAFGRSPAFAAQVADFNHDGQFDLVLWSSTGPEVLLNRGGARFSALEALPAVASSADPFAFRGSVADLDGDGFEDLLAADAAGKWHFISNRAGRFQEIPIEIPSPPPVEGNPLVQVEAAWLTAPGKLDLIALTRAGKLAVFEKAGPPAHWVEVKLKGFKSNTPGIGTAVEFKAANFYNKVLVTGGPVSAYTGDLAKLDVVRVTWPNQVIQNSINVSTDSSLTVQESERLASSCPLLYVWNGKRFVFVTDVLGVGPLGELAPDGTRIKPNSRELVRLPDFLRERGGDFTFQLTDELREVDYFDRLRLLAVDHPADENVYANEIYSSSAAPPELYAVRDERLPVSAVDDHGADVLGLLRDADGRYPANFRPHRIPGMAETHTLTLDLGEFPDTGHVSLWLTGWVFWTDSNGSRALMTNRNLTMIPPYLQVRNAEGRWTTVVPDMGLPSGTNRTMRVALSGKFLTWDHHVRLVTNLSVFWDRIFFTTNETRIQPSAELAPVAAGLHYRGFSVPVSDPKHRRPDFFEYTSLMKEAPWNPMTGNYTRYGEVGELLWAADDRLVVMATGDEMTVKFSARDLAPPRPGWKRTFFLDASGYAKDGEPNTAYSNSVAPLPFRAMENYPPSPADRTPADSEYRRYLREYQTRPRRLLLPPLAPPKP